MNLSIADALFFLGSSMLVGVFMLASTVKECLKMYLETTRRSQVTTWDVKNHD